MPFHGSRLVVHPEYEPTLRAQNIATPADAARKWAPADGERSRVADVRIPHAGATAHLFIKTYHYPGLWRLRTLLIPARVRREYENLLGLAKLGLRVPRPVAYGETRRFGFLTDSFLATEAIENAIDLRELAVDASKSPFPLPNRRERRELITAFAHALRRCHDAGWFLHTAFFKNLLLSKSPSGYSLWVIADSTAPWTVIFSRAVGVFHTPYPGEERDALRVTAAPEQGSHMEVLAFYFPVVARDSAVLRLHWGETILPMVIETRD